MALKAVLSTLDGVDEALHPLYTKGDDGSYYLDIEDIKMHPSTKPLTTTLEKLKRDKQAALDAAKAFDGIDVELYRELVEARENAENNGNKDDAKALQAKLDTLKERLTQQFTTDLTKKEQEVAKRDAAIRKLVLDNGLQAAIDKVGVKPEYRSAVKALMREKKVDVVEEGDEYIGIFRTELGDVPISEFVENWAKGDEATHYLPPDRKGGSGAPAGGQRTNTGTVTTFDRNDAAAWGANLDAMLKGEAAPR